MIKLFTYETAISKAQLSQLWYNDERMLTLIFNIVFFVTDKITILLENQQKHSQLLWKIIQSIQCI